MSNKFKGFTRAAEGNHSNLTALPNPFENTEEVTKVTSQALTTKQRVEELTNLAEKSQEEPEELLFLSELASSQTPNTPKRTNPFLRENN